MITPSVRPVPFDTDRERGVRALQWACRNVTRALARAHNLGDHVLVADLAAASRDLREIADLYAVPLPKGHHAEQ